MPPVPVVGWLRRPLGSPSVGTANNPSAHPIDGLQVFDMVDAFPNQIFHNGLLLRCPTERDLGWIIEACQDPEIPRYTRVPSPYTEVEGREFLSRAQQGFSDGADSTIERRPYVVLDEADAGLGMFGFFRVAPERATLEVGYWMTQPARGKGVATQALTALTIAALQAGYERIEAEVLLGNDASCRLLERVGYTHEGILRSIFDSEPCGGSKRVDLHLYSMVTNDPPAQTLRNHSLESSNDYSG